ncbi:hypothetical protein K457DRAFT_23915 [Linnemannia elongata AG-77]|uniref:Uncharacterized protein n=1 Tax=Linnemannia elongata AG-77 TaxID=1314771 RepID=A0A197JJJ3_9FUNG|nr:hypothetical protein K457DRAFT_23915 [Linnemannia elongata AG-77]
MAMSIRRLRMFLGRILQLPRHADHTPILLPDIVVSHNELPPIQAPPFQGRLAAVQVQQEALVIDAVQEQDTEDYAVETENMQVDFEFEEETQQR